MPESLVVDSSTLIALEKANLAHLLKRINYVIIIPKAVKEEINNEKVLKFLKIKELKGRSLKLSKHFEYLGIGNGEAECCILANSLKLRFMLCDDRRFIRQKFLSNNKQLQSIKILGFSFFLHIFYKKKLIKDVLKHFHKIIKLNNWERSEVFVANYTFLKEMGY